MADVILARYRNSDYIVRCEIDGVQKKYTWKGSKGNKIDRKKVPQSVVDWLIMNTVCFSKGALVVEGDKKTIEEIVEEFSDKEEYESNTHSYEEIVKILKGHHKTMEKELKKITVDDEKRFIVDVAKEIQDELTAGKLKFIAEWYGQEYDILFG